MSTDFLKQASEINYRYFGHKNLYSHQIQILNYLFAGRDCLAVLPTGSGKSLMYILPALVSYKNGMVLVISPLIALIREQVAKLQHVGIACASVDSVQTREEKAQAWAGIQSARLSLLFVSPERLALPRFREALKHYTSIRLIAIDEAHCISQWGNHFRPDYRRLGGYIADLGNCQKLALTATATIAVQDEIKETLNMSQPGEVLASFWRDNLALRIKKSRHQTEHQEDVQLALKTFCGQGIIYAPTRKKTQEIFLAIKRAQIAVAMYHGGMTAVAREQAQEAFMKSKIKVIVATKAFGMGIDKQDIRFVLHAGLPSSIEQYIQEVGRAGRDGKSAYGEMFFQGKDYYLQKFIIEKSFPPVWLVESVWKTLHRLLQDDLSRRGGSSELCQLLQHSFPKFSQEVVALFDRFTREFLLVSEQGLVSFGEDASEKFHRWIKTYPDRKNNQLNQLNMIYYYALCPEKGRMARLKSYFKFR